MATWIGKAFNTSVLKEKRYSWIDYLRGIAIILVVYHHVRIGIERSHIIVPQFLVEANMIFYSFRMPLFFLISGIFINLSLKKKSIRQVLSVKFENLLYPYFIWVFLQITLQIMLSQFTNSQRGWIDYTYIFYHPRYLDQFWYLPALFNVSLFYLLIKSKFNPPAWIHLLLGLVLYFSSPFLLNISMLSDWMEFYIFFAIGNAVTELFFKASTQKFFSDVFSFFLLLPLFITSQVYYLQHDIGEKTLSTHTAVAGITDYINRMLDQFQFLLIALVGCCMMMIIAFRLQKLNILSFLKVLGYHSLYIYVMHVIVIGFVRLTFINVFGITEPVSLLITGIFFGVVLPVVFYNLFINNGPLWFLFSFKRKKEKKKAIPPAIQELKTTPELVASQVS